MRALVGLVTVAVALSVAAPASTQPHRPVRVVTFNVFHGGAVSGLWGDDHRLEDRFELALAELRRLDADVVALQEASASWGRGQVARRLAEQLGMRHVWASATSRVFVWPFGRLVTWLLNFAEGPAILSRYPIVASTVHELPRCTKRIDPRVALEARLATPWGDLTVFSTHTSNDDCQVRHVAALARERRGVGPAIVMGDLNFGETSGVIAQLTTAEGFVDAFRAAHPDAAGPTVWQRVDSPVPTVMRRVDYVLVLEGGDRGVRVRDSRVVLDTPRRDADGTTLWPSDHYGVMAELELAPHTLNAATTPGER